MQLDKNMRPPYTTQKTQLALFAKSNMAQSHVQGRTYIKIAASLFREASFTFLYKTSRTLRLLCPCLLLVSAIVQGQQVSDTNFIPRVAEAAFTAGQGPRVGIDEAHFNFHTSTGRYAPFAALLQSDGFVVSAIGSTFTPEALATIDVLVISNALNERNASEWSLPTPSAFTAGEIALVRNWVADGGALLLIADHMPFGGAAAELALAFGFEFTNGYAMVPNPGENGLHFTRANNTLKDHAVVRGRNADEAIETVVTFTGQAFAVAEGKGLLELPEDAFLLLPETAGRLSPDTPRSAAGGLFQGATHEHGKGRIAMFGEAAMFSAQLGGPAQTPMGMNSPGAEQNAQFALNVMHWLAGLLP